MRSVLLHVRVSARWRITFLDWRGGRIGMKRGTGSCGGVSDGAGDLCSSMPCVVVAVVGVTRFVCWQLVFLMLRRDLNIKASRYRMMCQCPVWLRACVYVVLRRFVCVCE